ncbi:MAG: bifunctional UDP-N-acetylglucosamine diphosphorylase/glucosamine-1-phosphate N-acetyltransferase GlmU [Salinarimonadaceae bacterium]|nr:MAG: bifunctional UDP-N-acetylglucosamine diphosphorylase/glucosamine-1-phosphate N-acetyltransferase GlmU [Salinarimonadaceae bacterium]
MPDAIASRSCLAIVLAAGEGTRMRSSLPKVLHPIAGRSMVEHVLAAVMEAGAGRIAVVVGPDREDVAEAVRKVAPEAEIFVQRERLGTAHAALAARDALARQPVDDVIVAFADTPLVDVAAFSALRAPLAEGAGIVALGFEAADPHGYGRLIMERDRLIAIREEKDASDEERRIRLCNAGLMAFAGAHALSLMVSVGNENAKGEYYLTDAVGIAAGRDLPTRVVRAPEALVQGVNDRVQLAAAEQAMQRRLRERAMREGATLIDPDTVYLSFDTQLGRDVVVEPNVFFAPGVTVGEGAVIHAFSHLEGAKVGPRAEIGPFARLRPGAELGRKAKVGNFVEVKKSVLGEGAKVNHLTYIGDAEVGAGANIGAGTITCNYDGFGKHRTMIGEGAFIGSNSSLVAPVSIGAGAYVGSGSVVTKDVPADALALARGRQTVIKDWAVGFREKNAKK